MYCNLGLAGNVLTEMEPLIGLVPYTFLIYISYGISVLVNLSDISEEVVELSI